MTLKTTCSAIFLAHLLLLSSNAYAWTWRDLFLTGDQQGAEYLQKNNPVAAAEHFKNPNWKGVAYYQSGDYKRAVNAFSQNETELNVYNRSLAYARMGDYDQAIADLERVLKANPANQKALDNIEIFRWLKKQQTHAKGKQEQTKYDNFDKEHSRLSQQPKKGTGSKPEDKISPDEMNDGHRKRPRPGSTADKGQQQNASQSNGGEDKDGSPGQQAPRPQPSIAEREQEQAKQQWLKRIPDDPGGLLREKFLRDYQRRQQVRG